MQKSCWKKSECRYSIIIPARNSSETLRYTLQTCLEQRYDGDYEIVLSDNSTEGNQAVYELYRELNDPRIKYYKTPREYGLTKSFEFAVLHAKGQFILPIGSDDGVLPWTLEVLDETRKEYPDEEIIVWQRGFYAWPGFNDGQQNQFIIPKKYIKDKFDYQYVTQKRYLQDVCSNSMTMYRLPNLYINSGCTKRYLQKVLKMTGEMYEGICQDICMGVLNMCINPKVLHMEYPLTIAGMSSNSMGKITEEIHKEIKEENKRIKDIIKVVHIGEYSPLYYEKLFPELPYNDIALYRSLLRAVSLKLLPQEFLDVIDWKEIFVQLTKQINKQNIHFDKQIHYYRYVAAYQEKSS